jgi:NAD-dependent dihydropyrimidine dehydrogenase PreA subunit
VLVTGNYLLTVLRLTRALRGLDLYLLVANSRGINVWCAACGGHFTHHDVVSAIKTSGIEGLVNHKTIILPQLAAPGVEMKEIKKKTGWRAVWGPVSAKDIPLFLKKNLEKTKKMRRVEFPFLSRLEMAIVWAVPMSLVSIIIFVWFWPSVLLPLILLIWGLSLLIFLSFPLYEKALKTEGKRIIYLQLILFAFVLFGLFASGHFFGDLSWGFFLRWGIISLVIILLLTADLTGSTPIVKSATHEERRFSVSLDDERCKGIGVCGEVCPRNCFDVDRIGRTAHTINESDCIQCGACIVQCPLSALSFVTPGGGVVEPETIRRYKLNLMGKRIVKT